MNPEVNRAMPQAAGDQQWITAAIELAVDSVSTGGGPFGAVIISAQGELLAEGQNRVTHDCDPTAHAEVVAIRAACQQIGSFSLTGATLYTSCEPCPMCLASGLWARLDRVVYSADRYQAAAGGFDDSAFYTLFAMPTQEWSMPQVQHLPMPTSDDPFQRWRSAVDRTDY